MSLAYENASSCRSPATSVPLSTSPSRVPPAAAAAAATPPASGRRGATKPIPPPQAGVRGSRNARGCERPLPDDLDGEAAACDRDQWSQRSIYRYEVLNIHYENTTHEVVISSSR